MKINKTKIIIFTAWLFVLAIGPYTIFKNTNLGTLKSNPLLIVNILQRIAGIAAFTLVFFQIILGAFMEKLTQKLGGWIFKFHIIQGPIAYSLILLHPLLLVLFNFKIFGKFDPFYIFTDFCVLCKPVSEYYLTFGRIAFWLVTFAVVAAKFRTRPFFRKNWRVFHSLNYLAFFFIVIHSFKLGSDATSMPFLVFYIFSIISVISIIIYKMKMRMAREKTVSLLNKI